MTYRNKPATWPITLTELRARRDESKKLMSWLGILWLILLFGTMFAANRIGIQLVTAAQKLLFYILFFGSIGLLTYASRWILRLLDLQCPFCRKLLDKQLMSLAIATGHCSHCGSELVMDHPNKMTWQQGQAGKRRVLSGGRGFLLFFRAALAVFLFYGLIYLIFVAYFNRGFILEKLGRPEEALAVYTKTINANPKNAGAYINRGAILEKLGRTEDALADYTKAGEVALKNDIAAVAYNNKGATLVSIGKYKEAVAAYTHAIEIDPRNAIAYNNRSVALNLLGRLEGTTVNSNKTIEINSTLTPSTNSHLIEHQTSIQQQ